MKRRAPTAIADRPAFLPLKIVLAIVGGFIDVPETDAEDCEWPASDARRFVVSKRSDSGRTAHPLRLHAPVPISWIAGAAYPINISRYGFAQVGEDLYVISGFSGGGNTNVVNRYNATTNVWTPCANIPQPGQALSAAYYDGKIYATEGNAGPGLQIYDIATNTWGPGPPRPGVTDSYGSAMGAYLGKIFVVGGGTGGASTTVSLYNLAGNSWTAGSVAPAPYLLGGYTQIGQFLYCVGSFASTAASNSNVTMRLDMSTNTWSTGPTWTLQRADFALAAAGTKLFAIGGDSNGGTFFDESAQVDELETANWPSGTWVMSLNNLPAGQQGNQAGFFSTGQAGGEIWSTRGFQPATSQHLFRGVPCIITFNGTLGSNSNTYPGTSGTQNGRLARGRDPNTCGLLRSGGIQSGSLIFTFDAYSFTNNGPATCVTFNLDTECHDEPLFAVAYLGTFDPAHILTNYLADMGRSPPFANAFSFDVPANATVVLVVSEVVSNGECTDYKVTVSGLPCACFGGRVLIPYGDTGAAPTQLQTALQVEPGIVSVDLFNANTGTPTLAQLQQYDVVAPLAFSAFMNPATLGNNLADYVDGGGVVVQFGLTYSQFGSRNITGRWATDGYSPYTNSSSTGALTHTLGSFDASHPLMQGVTALQSNSRAVVTPAAGATQIAAWDDNASLIAVKPIGSHTAVGVTAYIGAQTTWSGDFARVIANAGRWLNCVPLQLTSAVSRKSHGGTPFDIDLPLTGQPNIECRTGGAGKNHTLVFTFNSPVVAGSAVATSSLGVGNGSVSGSPIFSGKTMTVNLTGVTDQQKITVTLNNITDTSAQVLTTTAVSMNVLLGDTTANKSVNASDVSQTKSRSGIAISAANFRNDVTLSGSINASDVSQVKANSGHAVP
jgi:hypothetical protein